MCEKGTVRHRKIQIEMPIIKKIQIEHVHEQASMNPHA
jgi:hypothetical protein